MREPFGKRNRRVVVAQQPARKRPARGRPPESDSRATFYVYVTLHRLRRVRAGMKWIIRQHSHPHTPTETSAIARPTD